VLVRTECEGSARQLPRTLGPIVSVIHPTYPAQMKGRDDKLAVGMVKVEPPKWCTAVSVLVTGCRSSVGYSGIMRAVGLPRVFLRRLSLEVCLNKWHLPRGQGPFHIHTPELWTFWKLYTLFLYYMSGLLPYVYILSYMQLSCASTVLKSLMCMGFPNLSLFWPSYDGTSHIYLP
jgi:hypothetical protein